MNATLTQDLATETEDDGEWTNCEHCLESVLIADTDDDCYCPRCSTAARAHAEAEARYEEAVDEQATAESDLEGLQDDLRDLEAQLKEKRAEIAEARARISDAAKDVTKYGRQLEAAEAELDKLSY
jgi:septal ring factor EnvC (AmiA/AmiB activator)